MAKNTGEGYRIGAVKDRSQVQKDDGSWAKRDAGDGTFIDNKAAPDPYKGVAKEPDDRSDRRGED
ncbi:hypothetical protein [Parvularcula dongshanensis]|uniref:Uncharacterized protein n=1 Tax=Parvularcula dongshanensis TaxID=1173995 RepID=A0A840I1Z1_9PROT|nr:hypothetical protein [Parvularcula dongshanensis]MBB4658208.1 hypothetical protein [Parvularcula dongshanensis]